MPQYQSVYQNQLLLQLVQMQALPPRAALSLMDIENKPSILSAMDRFADSNSDGNNAEEERS